MAWQGNVNPAGQGLSVPGSGPDPELMPTWERALLASPVNGWRTLMLRAVTCSRAHGWKEPELALNAGRTAPEPGPQHTAWARSTWDWGRGDEQTAREKLKSEHTPPHAFTSLQPLSRRFRWGKSSALTLMELEPCAEHTPGPQ